MEGFSAFDGGQGGGGLPRKHERRAETQCGGEVGIGTETDWEGDGNWLKVRMWLTKRTLISPMTNKPQAGISSVSLALISLAEYHISQRRTYCTLRSWIATLPPVSVVNTYQ